MQVFLGLEGRASDAQLTQLCLTQQGRRLRRAPAQLAARGSGGSAAGALAGRRPGAQLIRPLAVSLSAPAALSCQTLPYLAEGPARCLPLPPPRSATC